MEFFVKSVCLEILKIVILVFVVGEGCKFGVSVKVVDDVIGGVISVVFKCGDLVGKVGQILFLQSLFNFKVECVLLVGVGKECELGDCQYCKLVFVVLLIFKGLVGVDVVLVFGDFVVKGCGVYVKVCLLVEILVDGLYVFDCYKSQKVELLKLKKLILFVDKVDSVVVE